VLKTPNRRYPPLDAAVVLLLIMMILLETSAVLWAFKRTEDASQRVRESLSIIDAGQQLHSEVLFGEFELRRFLQEGNESFAAEFTDRKARMMAHLEVLQQAGLHSVADLHLNKLASLLHARWADIEAVVGAQDASRPDAEQFADRLLQFDPNLLVVHFTILDLLSAETKRLRARDAGLDLNMGDRSTVVFAGGMLLLLLVIMGGLITRRIRGRVELLVHEETLELLNRQEALNTELMLSNGKLRSSEAKLEITLNSMGDGVLATDVNACVTRLNPVAVKLTGWSEAEALGRPIDEIFRILKKETREAAVNPVMAALAHGTVQGLANHTVLIARDGGEYDIADSCAAIRSHDNEIVGAVLIFRNVSSEYLAQQAIRDSTAKMEAILSTVVDGIVTLDADTDQIATANPATERMFGYTEDELHGENFRLLVPGVDQRRNGAALDHFNAGDDEHSNGQEREVIGRRKDGSAFPLEMAVREMWVGGKRSFAALLRDITARKNLDQILLDRNRELQLARSVADAANLAKSDFLSSMSHELRTPLSAILGFAQLIDIGVPPPTPVQKRSVDQILKAGWYLLELINEVLDLAMVESGNLVLSMEPILLSDILQVCKDMIHPQAVQRNISVDFNTGANPYFVHADRIRLQQVLINLLSNAIKYNRPDGSIIVDCLPASKGRLRIRVSDTGEGLSEDQLAQLFQPFNRLGQEGTVEEGTGIGLVVSKRLVELMDGSIGAESVVGVGSVFWFELGLSGRSVRDEDAEEIPARTTTTLKAGASTQTLLYVEDNPANLMLVEDLLSRRPGIRLLTATTGDSGVEMARVLLPDVILMDINLPGISGLEALRILSRDPTTAHIPVIALSANAMPSDIKKGLEAGFRHYLTKPIKVLKFLTTLDETFAKLSSDRKTRPVDQPDAHAW